jgi:hypothetical protein
MLPNLHNQDIIVDKLSTFLSLTKKPLHLLLVGNNGSLIELFSNKLGKLKRSGLFTFEILGRKSEEDISALLQTVDFGVSRVPANLIGKSGTAIAMLEHGLPIWIPAESFETEVFCIDFRPELCYNDLATLLTDGKKQTPLSRLNQIAAQFVEDLGNI